MTRSHFFVYLVRHFKPQLVGLGVLGLAMMASVIAVSLPQDVRRKAADTSTAKINVTSSTALLPPNTSQVLSVWAILGSQASLDGIQFEVAVTGMDPKYIAFIANQDFPNDRVLTKKEAEVIKVAYLPIDPKTPIPVTSSQPILIGKLNVRTPATGAVNLSFNSTRTMIIQHGFNVNQLGAPADFSFPVGIVTPVPQPSATPVITPSPSFTPTPTSTPVPTPTPAPTPTPIPTPSPTPSPILTSSIDISRLVLINSQTKSPIKILATATSNQINLADTPKISIQADIKGLVKSVKFQTASYQRIENQVPFAIAGGMASYTPWNVTPGKYTLTVTPYLNTQAGGDFGKPMIVNLDVINVPATTPKLLGYNLINARTNTIIRQLGKTNVVSLADAPEFNIESLANGITQSVKFTLNGQARTENYMPYTLRGNNVSTYNKWVPNPGTYTITAQAFTKDGATGTASALDTFTITFTSPTATANVQPTLTLVNSLTQANIMALNNGSSFSIKKYPNISIKATNLIPSTKSVVFSYPGYSLVESTSPYAINGDLLGIIRKWPVKVGSYPITVKMYNQTNGTGTLLGTRTITIKITE